MRRAVIAALCLVAGLTSPVRAEQGAGPRLATPLPGSSMSATFRIEAWLKREIPGGDYAAELIRAYQERAGEEAGFDRRGRRNWFDATAFFAKAERAAQGEETPPWSPHQLGLGDPLLIAAHRATVRRSLRYRAAAPDACAQMVALFDHWLERQRDAAAGPAQGRLFKRWAEAFRACSAPVKILGFPIGGCANTDNDAKLRDAPEQGRRERRKAEILAEEIGAEERSGVLSLVGAKLRLSGYASATGSGGKAKSLGGCRANFVKQLLVRAGVSDGRIAVADQGASGAGEAYADRKVVLRQN